MGMHDHPTQKLGKKDPYDWDDSNHPVIDANDHFLLSANEIPPRPMNNLAPSFDWPMDHNDEAGDCVVAGLDHFFQTVYGLLGIPYNNWTDDELLAFYQTQNPGFKSWADSGGPHDNGMSIQEFLTYLAKHNYILGFARLDHTNEDVMRMATYLGLAVVTGQMMQKAQQDANIWDYVAGSPNWGGHCTISVGYRGAPDVEQWISWGKKYDVTPLFIQHQMDEAWLVITNAHLQYPNFREGFGLSTFGEEYTALTGRPFRFQPEPQPTPTPTPNPTPTDSPTLQDLDLNSAITALDASLGHTLRHYGSYSHFKTHVAAWRHSKGL